MQRVIVQADRTSRMQAEEILGYNVRNTRGQLVPLSSFATVNWAVGPAQIVGFNYYPSVRISGSAKPGFTSGDAIREMERLARQLPRGFGFEWTGQSLQEKQSGSQAPLLLGAVGAAGVPGARRALRELDHPARSAAYRAARHSWRGRSPRCCAACRTTSISPWHSSPSSDLAAKDGILIIEFAKVAARAGQVR